MCTLKSYVYLHLKIRVVGGREGGWVGGWIGVVVSGQQTLYKEMIWCAIIIICSTEQY